MFSGDLQKRLELLNPDLVHTSDTQLHVIEKKEGGAADLTLELKNPCILFEDLENKKLQYFQNHKCADCIVYEQKDDAWMLHVFELKRTVRKEAWKDMKLQYTGAMQNALAVAGFLGIMIDLEHVKVYSVYRNDKINDYANPAKIREQMHEKKSGNVESDGWKDWNESEAELNFLGKSKFPHEKIRVDVETGNGSYVVA